MAVTALPQRVLVSKATEAAAFSTSGWPQGPRITPVHPVWLHLASCCLDAEVSHPSLLAVWDGCREDVRQTPPKQKPRAPGDGPALHCQLSSTCLCRERGLLQTAEQMDTKEEAQAFDPIAFAHLPCSYWLLGNPRLSNLRQ